MPAKLKTVLRTPDKADGDIIVVAVPEGRSNVENPLHGAPLKRAFGKLISPHPRAGQRHQGKIGDRTLVAWGYDSNNIFEPSATRAWLSEVVEYGNSQRAKRLSLVLPHGLLAGIDVVERAVVSIADADYRFDELLSKKKKSSLRQVQLVVEDTSPLRASLDFASKVVEGAHWCRELANTPPNIATPEWMAEQARARAEQLSLSCEVLEPEELTARGMGGIIAVGGGSSNGPRLVRLEYGTRGPRVSLVGKGVTFDTGGISIKPSASMEEMKFDKCGACTVLGITHAVARLELPIRLTTFVPLAENMPDGSAYRPGDIVRCYGGKTVEILNTDAEGRMLLADALALASESKPDYLIDYATLTGACVVALGEGAAGLYARDDELASALLESATNANQRLWRMPLWPEFVKQMQGNHADLKNSGGRWGGANTAAAFLSQFTDDNPRWAHLDIAGPAYTSKNQAHGQFGATGYGVHLTLDWLSRLAPELD